MLFLVTTYAAKNKRKPLIAAARNVHKSFLSAAALLDFEIDWLFGRDEESYLSCLLSPQGLGDYFVTTDRLPDALYITSPDYLGNMQDVSALAEVCHRFGVLLLVDNAHGAYLKFLPKSTHPMDLGADMACDSAHKTLPVLTGGGYLHLSNKLPDYFADHVKNAMALFGSTSPSYLILASLDLANKRLAKSFPSELKSFLPVAEKAKGELVEAGYCFVGSEPLKWTVSAADYGYTGEEIAQYLVDCQMVPEFYDYQYLTLMLSPNLGENGVESLKNTLKSLEKRPVVQHIAQKCAKPEVCLSVRESNLTPSETLPTADCVGRIVANPSNLCPPAVPIVVSGEKLTKELCDLLLFYGHENCCVVAE